MEKIKRLFMLMAILIPAIAFTACSDDDKDEPTLNDIVGTWKLSQVSTDNGQNYIAWPFKTTTATFKSDGTYSGQGYFGNGSGTWKQNGKTIITYVGGEEYMRYEVKELTSTTCTLVMAQDGSSMWVKCVKI